MDHVESLSKLSSSIKFEDYVEDVIDEFLRFIEPSKDASCCTKNYQFEEEYGIIESKDIHGNPTRVS